MIQTATTTKKKRKPRTNSIDRFSKVQQRKFLEIMRTRWNPTKAAEDLRFKPAEIRAYIKANKEFQERLSEVEKQHLDDIEENAFEDAKHGKTQSAKNQGKFLLTKRRKKFADVSRVDHNVSGKIEQQRSSVSVIINRLLGYNLPEMDPAPHNSIKRIVQESLVAGAEGKTGQASNNVINNQHRPEAVPFAPEATEEGDGAEDEAGA